MHKKERPTQQEAEEAVRTLIRFAGDDPQREALIKTPSRVARSYLEFFCGYQQKLDRTAMKTFPVPEGFDGMIQLNGIRLESFCEHHMCPIIGNVSIAYRPKDRIIGLSKLARIVDIHAKQLQVQERLVVEIGKHLEEMVDPLGVAVVIDATHHCLTTRGVHKVGAIMRTDYFSGCFKQYEVRKEFIDNIRGNKND